MWATTRATPSLPRHGWGEGNAESSYHFTNHCTRSFRIERILIFANLAERQGEVKSRGYPPRDNHIKAPPSGSTFAFAPVSLHAGPKKERKRTPTKPAKPPLFPSPHASPPSPSGINRGPGNNKRKPDARWETIAFRLGIKREDSRILFLTTIPTVCVILRNIPRMFCKTKVRENARVISSYNSYGEIDL